jgi:hypothetical protein
MQLLNTAYEARPCGQPVFIIIYSTYDITDSHWSQPRALLVRTQLGSTSIQTASINVKNT